MPESTAEAASNKQLLNESMEQNQARFFGDDDNFIAAAPQGESRQQAGGYLQKKEELREAKKAQRLAFMGRIDVLKERAAKAVDHPQRAEEATNLKSIHDIAENLRKMRLTTGKGLQILEEDLDKLKCEEQKESC